MDGTSDDCVVGEPSCALNVGVEAWVSRFDSGVVGVAALLRRSLSDCRWADVIARGVWVALASHDSRTRYVEGTQLARAFDNARRRETCVHEAGHAVIHALAGIEVVRLAVAPEGSESWDHTNETGQTSSGARGFCMTASYPLPLLGIMTWDREDSSYRTNPARFSEMLQLFAQSMARVAKTTSTSAIVREYRRLLRGHACGALAGRAAAQLHVDGEVWLTEAEDPDDPQDDVARASGFARLMKNPLEYSNLCRVTVAALQEADIWTSVTRLADELEQRGVVDDPEEWVPPPRLNWPPCPPSSRRRSPA
jgi:hypothetical protein